MDRRNTAERQLGAVRTVPERLRWHTRNQLDVRNSAWLVRSSDVPNRLIKGQIMKKLLRYFLIAGPMAIVPQSSLALAQSSSSFAVTPPSVPFNVEVPAGNTLFLKGEAQGTQNYICLPSASGFSWTFFSPQATLFFTIKLPGDDFRQQIITHFLSPNPDEGGLSRVTWQSSLDTSAVWARLHPGGLSTDSNFVAVGAVPGCCWRRWERRPGPRAAKFSRAPPLFRG